MEKEDLIKKPVKVLDHGYVELIDYMGSDEMITNAARVSYQNVKTRSQDRFLIDYLMRNEHTSPFEQVVFTFRLKMPIFVARQWVRHRTARMNEVSARYSVLGTDFYMPEDADMNYQSKDNKQGRGEAMSAEDSRKAKDVMAKCYALLEKSYNELLDTGLSKEIARMILPLSVYTEFYWQMDLHNLFHFLKLRLHKHAQLEIRKYAEIILEMVEKVCPMATESFINHNLKSVRISEKETEMIRSNLDFDAIKGEERDLKILKEKFQK